MKIAKAKAVEFEAKKKAEYSPHDGLIHKPYGNNQQRYFSDGKGSNDGLVRGVNNYHQSVAHSQENTQRHKLHKKHHNKHQ